MRNRVVVAICMAWMCLTQVAGAQEVVWAKGAAHFGHECRPSVTSCVLASVPSPDKKKIVRVSRSGSNFSFAVIAGSTSFQIHPHSGMPADFEEPYVEMEVLWSPDSSAFSVAWNESAITSATELYTLEGNGLHRVDMNMLKRAFAERFPPCVGGAEPCDIDPHGDLYSYLTVGWAAPHTVVLLAEVPPSSSYGRNMGKVLGYEVNGRDGQILRTLAPAAFKRKWHSRMGWNFNVANAEGVQP